MNSYLLKGFLVSIAVPTATLISTATVAQVTQIRLRAVLTAPPAAGDISGQSTFQRRGTVRKFSVEVEGLRPGTVFNVIVANRIVGRIRIDAFGQGDLNYDDNFEPGDDPRTRFPANFPPVQPGTVIRVGQLSGAYRVR